MDDTALYVFFGVALGEAFSSGLWQRWYFRSGLVVFSRRIQASRPGSPLPASGVLEASLKSSWLPSLLFREFSPGEIAFREKVLEFRLFTYTPLMHGRIEALPFEPVILVQGRLNWFSLLFVLALISGPAREVWYIFLPFAAGLFALIYAIQAFRYRQVVALLTQPRGSAA